MSQEIESTPTTFELRCNSTGQIDNVAEVACNPIKCGFKFPDYMQSHVHYTNFTEYYFGYGNKKTFQCEEGYSTYREDFYTAGNHTIDNTVVAECLIDGTTNYTRLDGTRGSVGAGMLGYEYQQDPSKNPSEIPAPQQNPSTIPASSDIFET